MGAKEVSSLRILQKEYTTNLRFRYNPYSQLYYKDDTTRYYLIVKE